MSITSSTKLSDIDNIITNSKAKGLIPFIVYVDGTKHCNLPCQATNSIQSDFIGMESNGSGVYWHTVRVTTTATQECGSNITTSGYAYSALSNLSHTATLYYKE